MCPIYQSRIIIKFIRTTYQGGDGWLFRTTVMKLYIAKAEGSHGDEKVTEVEWSDASLDLV